MSDQVIGVTIKGIGDFSDVVSNVGSVQKALSKLKLPDKLGDNLNKNITNFMKEYEKYQQKIAGGIKTQGDYNQVEKSLNRMRSLYQEIGKDALKLTQLDMKDMLNLDTGEFKKISDELTSIIKQIGNTKMDISPFTKAFAEIRSITKNSKVTGDNGLLSQMIGHINTGQITEAKKQLQELQAYANKVAPRFLADGKQAPGTLSTEKYNQLTAAIEVMATAFGKADAEMAPLIEAQNRLQKELDETKQKAAQSIGDEFDKYNQAEKDVEQVTDALKRMHQEEFSFNREAQNIDRQIQSFFGLSQVIRKVGDIARDAFATVKELDKAMTETAVVTNFSVGDMWSMLPTYTAQANQLGSTIRDVYEAATLYYQQGLNNNQAMALANETLKMARIAGLEAAEATDMMTAALRGFNMEINQTSAQRINDVYSELAAITASDTQEIGSAMERTASIANSANMEFETTSAFLAQMIETTREAPENLGTAMKTIVARFQEMKQDPTKLVDSEGVAMDANKVDKALKTIGVSLMNTKGEFRDLDDVFLDIASRWDSLTQGQQRYIATIAAGSRQQSRFIAMMSNYERTMELVDAANNSAGASQRQFEKTLDSMEAKLNKLKNAWDQFTMGLMNNQILKTGVTLLTGAFTVINKIIDILGSIPSKPFEGITKSALTLVATLGMLQLGKRGSRGLVQGTIGWWKEGKSFGKTFAEGWAGPEGTKAIAKQSKYGDAIKASIISANIPNTIQGEFQKGKVLATMAFSTGAKLVALENIINEAALTEEAKVLGIKIKEEIEAEIQNGTLNPDLMANVFNRRFADAIGNTEFQISPQELNQQAAQVDILGNSFSKAGLKITKAGNALQIFGSKIGGPIGNALVRIGNTMVMLGDQAVDLTKKFKKAIEATKGIDTLSGKGKAFGGEMFPGLSKALKTLLSLPLPLKIIGVVVATIAATWAIVAGQQKKVLNEAIDAAAAAADAYDSAKQETSELSDQIEQIKSNENAFDGLVVGTAAFNEQLIIANQQITELLNKYPMLNDPKYLSTDKNGLMHINDAGLEAVKNYQKQKQANASALNLIQTADLNTVETRQKADRMRHLRRGETGTDESYRQRVKEAELLEQQVAAQKDIATISAVNVALIDKEIRNREKVSSIIADQYEARKAEINLNKESIHDLKQEYADFYGYKYDKSTKKITDIEGNEIDVDDKTVKDAVKEIRIITAIEADGKSLDSMINTIDARFSKALGDDFKDSAHLFSDLLSDNLDINNDLVNNLLANPDKLNHAVRSLSEKEIAAVLGVSADAVANAPEKYKKELIDKVAQKAQNIAETQAKSYEELISMLAQTRFTDISQVIDENGKSWTQEQKHNKLLLEQHLEKISSENKLLMSQVGTSLRDTMGTDVMKNYIGFMDDLYKGIAQHQFGNIDLNNREILKNADGTISTVLGSSGTFGKQEIPIAFSPMLQTGTGTPEKLNSDTINKYFDKIIDLTGGDAEQMLKLDARGLIIDGQRIHGLIADIGDTAAETGEKMHSIEMDKAAADEINSIFKNANLDTAIGRLDAFTKLSNSSIDITRELGESLLQSTDSANLLGEAFEEFYDSSDFQDLAENMDKFVDSSGKINAASVREMADQCSSLNKLLDTGTISAGGVAAALNALGENGSLTIFDLNQNLLKFLSTANQLEDVLSEAHSLIENFDWGVDTGESEDFAKDSSKKWKELYDNGEFGNQQLENYAKFVLGQERWNNELETSGGNIETALNNMSKDILKYSDGFEQAWVDMANSSAKEYQDVHWDNGDVIWETNGRTTEQLVEDLAKARGITQEWAKLMVEDFANYSYDFKTELARNDFAAGLEQYIPERTGENGLINVTLSELQTLADAQGTTIEGIKEEIAAKAGIDESQLNILENIDANGQALLDQESIEKLNQDYSKAELGNDTNQSWISQYQKLNEQGQGVANTAELKTAISGAISDGFQADQASEMARAEGLKAIEEGAKVFYDGVELQKSDLEDAAAFADKIAEITDNARWNQVGQAIAQGVVQYLFKSKNKDDNTKSEGTSRKDGGSGFQKNTIETTETITKTEVDKKILEADGEETPAFTKLYEFFASKDQDNIIFNILTQGADGLVGISELFDSIKQKVSTPVEVTTTSDITGINTVSTALGGIPSSKNVSITATDNTGSVISSIRSKLASLARKALSIGPSAKGHNNEIKSVSLPTFASAAKGKGKVGPKNKGGLTLTGEEGYEIAWLPSEGKSMIVGAGGPQMLNLPSDAVIYTHEQSQDILKRKSIPAGSHAGRHVSSGNGGGGGESKGTTTSKSVQNAASSVQKSAEEAAKAVKKVSVWWENIALRTEESQRRQDKNQKTFEKYLKQVGANLKNAGKSASLGGGGLEDYINSLNETLGYYQAQLTQANKELVNITTIKGQFSQEYMSSKYGVSGYENFAQISYKDGKDTKEELVDLAKFVRIINGQLIYNQSAFDSVSPEKGNAIKDAAVKLVNDTVSKKNKSEDEIEKIQEAFEKLGDEIYDTFFKWENELTKIWQIAKKIEQVEGRISRLKTYEELLNLQVETGLKQASEVKQEMMKAFNAGVKELEDSIHLEAQNIEEQKAQLQDLINIDKKRKERADIEQRLTYSIEYWSKNEEPQSSGSTIDDLILGLEPEKIDSSQEFMLLEAAKGLEKEIQTMSMAWDYLSVQQRKDGTLDIKFDDKAFEQDKYTKGMTTADAEAIQDYVKKIYETNDNLSSAYESLTSKMVEMNEKLKTLQDQWVGYAEELWKISDEQQKQEIDNLKKLSDSISDSLKNLLDEVKRKLDQRRKQEDNAKTEKDISRKQQRLAALRADTSGGNQVEIARLEQEIGEAQQNYQRTLEDQLLENLQQQADLAAQQRERQIALQEATVGAINNAALVNKWMDNPADYRAEIFEAYKLANEFDTKPEAMKKDLLDKFESMYTGLLTNQTEQDTVKTGLENTQTELIAIKNSIDAIQSAAATQIESGGAKSGITVGSTQTAVDNAHAANTPKTTSTPAATPAPAKPNNPKVSQLSRDLSYGSKGDDVKILQKALNSLGFKGSDGKTLDVDGYFGPNTNYAVKQFQQKYRYKASKTLAIDGVVGRYSREAFGALGYKTGGLADYTGPAWLDGTPSKPELVLNATDTANFIALKDILAKAMSGATNISNTSGDVKYEININVDKIEKDYDVDRVVDKVKKEITKSAGYRNVTQVRNLK